MQPKQIAADGARGIAAAKTLADHIRTHELTSFSEYCQNPTFVHDFPLAYRRFQPA